MMNKKELRKKFKDVRNSMLRSERVNFDETISDAFLNTTEYNKCEDLLAYVSSAIEVDTRQIIAESLKNKRVLCPRCVPKTNLMYFYRIDSIEQLKSGSFGILEPDESCERIVDFNEPLCIVPALSYDVKGYRLGFGKGFYDRFLCNFDGVSIGLCYDRCIVDSLPSDEFDISVDKVITEKNIYDLKNERIDRVNGR